MPKFSANYQPHPATRLGRKNGGRKYLLSEDQLAELVEWYVGRVSAKQMSHKLGVSQNTMYAALARLGYPIGRTQAQQKEQAWRREQARAQV
jgi:transposase